MRKTLKLWEIWVSHSGFEDNSSYLGFDAAAWTNYCSSWRPHDSLKARKYWPSEEVSNARTLHFCNITTVGETRVRSHKALKLLNVRGFNLRNLCVKTNVCHVNASESYRGKKTGFSKWLQWLVFKHLLVTERRHFGFTVLDLIAGLRVVSIFWDKPTYWVCIRLF